MASGERAALQSRPRRGTSICGGVGETGSTLGSPSTPRLARTTSPSVRASRETAVASDGCVLPGVGDGKPSTPCSITPRGASSSLLPSLEPTAPQRRSASKASTGAVASETGSLLEAPSTPHPPRLARTSSPPTRASRDSAIASEKDSLLGFGGCKASSSCSPSPQILTPGRRGSCPPVAVTPARDDLTCEKAVARTGRQSIGVGRSSKSGGIVVPHSRQANENCSVADTSADSSRDDLASEKIVARPGRTSIGPGRKSEDRSAADVTSMVSPKGGIRRSLQRPGTQQRGMRSRSTSINEDSAVAKKLLASAEKITTCFQTFDINNDGTISRDELAAVLKRLDKHVEFNDEDVNLIMRAVDTSGDGVIDYAEFAAWLTSDVKSGPLIREFRNHAEGILNTESPQEKLDRCSRALREGEKAALPPKFTKVDIEESDLWMFVKKGDEYKLTRTAEGRSGLKEDTSYVHQIVPNCSAYRAGVRIGWRVVEVGGLNLKCTAEVLEEIIKGFGGGGGAKRFCSVSFVSPEALQSQRDALKALPGLLEACELARAAIKKESEVEAPQAAVIVQYYEYKATFSTTHGMLPASDIDEVFCLSAFMPDCQLYLAELRPGDQHILSAEEMHADSLKLVQRDVSRKLPFQPGPLGIVVDWDSRTVCDVEPNSTAQRKGVLPGWTFSDVDSAGELERLMTGEEDYFITFTQRGIFSGLVTGRTYFLVVKPSVEASRSELVWRLRMQKEREAERLKTLSIHNCDVEQIPVALHATTRKEDFEVELDNSEGRSLGVVIEIDREGAALQVTEVLWFGLVHAWSNANPKMGIRSGDRILQINGVTGNGKDIEIELRKHQKLLITICRVDYELGDAVEGFFNNYEWRPATILEANANGTFTLKWANGSKDDTVKGPFELRKNESMDSCHTKVDGDFRFVGSQNGRAKYVNKFGALIYFYDEWRLDVSEDSVGAAYSFPGETGLRPPKGIWRSRVNPGRLAEICFQGGIMCRVCAQGLRKKQAKVF